MIEHKIILEDLGRWGFGLKFQARCTCRLWESRIEDNRPAVVQAHSRHRMQVGAVIWA